MSDSRQNEPGLLGHATNRYMLVPPPQHSPHKYEGERDLTCQCRQGANSESSYELVAHGVTAGT